MKSKRFYVLGLILSVALFIVAICLPESMGDTPAMIGVIGIICFVIFLIALIISAIRSRIRPSLNSQPSPVPKPAPITPPSQPKPAPKKSTSIERVHVRGVDKYAENIKAVVIENDDYNLTKRELQEDFLDERVWQYQFFGKAALVPEPDNEYDPNAIMVQADGRCIGYVPKGSTAHIRKLMESGRITYLDLKIGGGKYKKVTEIDDDDYELERGENPYSAVLEIHLTEE